MTVLKRQLLFSSSCRVPAGKNENSLISWRRNARLHSFSYNIKIECEKLTTTETSTVSQNVYLLEEAYGLGKNLLGGKGHGLVEMKHAGLPVPPGIIITTKVCSEYYENGRRFPEHLMPVVHEKMRKMEEGIHYKLIKLRSKPFTG